MPTEFTFFWKNRTPFSNWYPSKFVFGSIPFTRGEQYMMYQKAMLFKDVETAQKILATDDPKLQKDLGRQVKNYDEHIWGMVREEVMVEGLFEKFNQNPKLRQALLDTGDTIMAEASPRDFIWGIGMADDHPDVRDQSKWGMNLLGKVLMQVRTRLQEPQPVSIEWE